MSLQVIAGTHLKRDTPCANMVSGIIKKLTSEIYFNDVKIQTDKMGGTTILSLQDNCRHSLKKGYTMCKHGERHNKETNIRNLFQWC